MRESQLHRFVDGNLGSVRELASLLNVSVDSEVVVRFEDVEGLQMLLGSFGDDDNLSWPRREGVKAVTCRVSTRIADSQSG